jgi:hypothetical protein
VSLFSPFLLSVLSDNHVLLLKNENILKCSQKSRMLFFFKKKKQG